MSGKSNYIQYCLKCQKALTKDMCTDEYDNNRAYYCISTHDYDCYESDNEVEYDQDDPDDFEIKHVTKEIINEIWYYCADCKCYFLSCGKCNRNHINAWCQFLGSDGYDINGNEITRGDNPTIKYYVGDMKLFWLDANYILPTGPDGGMQHYWLCPICKFEFAITDK